MRRFLVFASLCGAVLWNSGTVAADASALAGRKPNIVLLITDDQGYGDISAHGNPILKTPNLDRLHDEGVRFTDFHVSPTCSPTRASLMSGRHEFKNGVTHTIFERERMSLSTVTLPQVLKTVGYTTGIFGKWHLGDEAEYQPNRRGFDEVYIHGGGGIGQTYPGSCGDAPGNKYFNPAVLHNGKFEKTQGYCTDLFFNQAAEWIEGRVKTGQGSAHPFFCYIATNAPHAPLDCPPEYEARYSAKVDQPDTAKFLGMVANIDDNVGRLLAKLADLGIERDTLFIFMNDNGGTAGVKVFNAGMKGQKGTPYRGGTRGASFWRWPGVLKPADCDRLTAHIDVFPTLLQIAGAQPSTEVAAQFDGRSLLPLLEKPDARWADRLLFTHVGRWPKGSDADLAKFANCSIRSPRWNLVSAVKPAARGGKINAAGGAKPSPAPASAGAMSIRPNWELYDSKADPGETKNVVAEHPDVVQKLTAAYDRWWGGVVPATLENERAQGPTINPFHVLYYKQFGKPKEAAAIESGAVKTTELAQADAAKAPGKRQAAGPARKPNPALAPIVDDPKLPRVLLIGDSISIGYTLDVRELLKGKANVHRIPTNGGPTLNPLTVVNGVENLTKWLGAGKWDVIHFNWGLHDIKFMPDGKRQVDPETYEKNLRKIVKQLRATGAKLIWCSTTPVPEGLTSPKRNVADVVTYNAIAEKVMDEAGVEIDDLYGFALPKVKEIQLPVNVHFHEKGSAVLATKVAEEIERRLPQKYTDGPAAISRPSRSSRRAARAGLR